MAEIIVLDSGPLGRLTHPARNPEIVTWLEHLLEAGFRVVIPEIADYEVRRSFLLTPKLHTAAGLDELANSKWVTQSGRGCRRQPQPPSRRPDTPSAQRQKPSMTPFTDPFTSPAAQSPHFPARFLSCDRLHSQRMTTLTAHFDGKVLIPDEPVSLPVDCALEVRVQPLKKRVAVAAGDRPLMKLLKSLEELPDNPDWPADGAAQHEHYLYGLPKKP